MPNQIRHLRAQPIPNPGLLATHAGGKGGFYFAHLFDGKLCVRVVRPNRESPLRHHVRSVVQRRADEQVTWVAARRVVASVADHCPVRRQYSSSENQGGPVGPHRATSDAKPPVPLAVARAVPRPTRVRTTRPVYLARETELVRVGDLGKGEGCCMHPMQSVSANCRNQGAP